MTPHATHIVRWTLGPRGGLRGRAFAVLALVALLTPSLLLAGGPGAAGWLSGHGHVYLTADAAAHAHQHPWDDAHTDGSAPTTGASATPGVVFTTGDLDGASALTMLALPAGALLLVISWWCRPLAVGMPVLAGFCPAPSSPPPQR